MSARLLSHREITLVAHALATEAVLGVLIRDKTVGEEKVRAWIDDVLSAEPDPQHHVIIERAMHFAFRMMEDGGPESILHFL